MSAALKKSHASLGTVFESSTLPWFTTLAIVVAAAPFVVSIEELTHPIVLAVALIGLLSINVLLRLIPSTKTDARLRCLLEVHALVVFAFLAAISTGALHSSLLSLFLLPLTAAAIVLSGLAYGITALLVMLAYALLSALTPHVVVTSATFMVHFIALIAPALVATTALSVIMNRMHSAERQIRTLTSSDALTGLYNIRAFEQRLAHEHRKAEHSGETYSITVIDIDDLERINDNLGHDAAQQIIVAVGEAIHRSIRTTDCAARMSGDEFAVLLIGADPATAATIVQRIRNNVFAGTIALQGRMVRAQVSAGIANFPKDHATAAQVHALASQRMSHDRELRAARAE